MAGKSGESDASDNVFVGYMSGSSNIHGSANTAIGNSSLLSSQEANSNTAVGAYSLYQNISGSNTSVGTWSLYTNSDGWSNTATGSAAMFYNTNGYRNTAIGESALFSNTTGYDNTAIGNVSGVSTGNLSNTTAIGSGAIATASNQVRLGNDNVTSLFCKGAYASTTINPSNLYVDANGQIMRSTSPFLGWSLIGNSGTMQGTDFIGTTDNVPLSFKVNNQLSGKIDPVSYNTSLGYTSLLSNTTGNYNSAFGTGSLQMNTIGVENTASGFHTLQNNTSGNSNSAYGWGALASNTTGGSNTAIGYGALIANSSGSTNTAMGGNALVSNTTGNSNIALGYGALNTNTSGSSNTAVGYYARASNGTLTNTTALGAGALANSNNQIRLGNDDITSLFCKGAYASTTTKPSNLYVDSIGQIMRSTINNDHARLHTMTSATDHSATPNKMFYSDNAGAINELPLGDEGKLLMSNGPAAAPSWMSDADTITKVMLLTELQRDSIPDPTIGMLIYNLDDQDLNFYNGIEWLGFSGSNNTNAPPVAPTAGEHVAAGNSIIWNWVTVTNAAGYRWNTINEYSSTIDLGLCTSKIDTALSCNASQTRYIWAYNGYGNSSATIFSQSTQNSGPEAPAAGTHIAYFSHIIWKWNHVPGAVAYKWNTINNFASAQLIFEPDSSTYHTENGLSCDSTYTRYVWAINSCGHSSANALVQHLNCPTSPTVAVTQIIDSANMLFSYATVTWDGGAPITSEGGCWSLSPNPTIADSYQVYNAVSPDFSIRPYPLNPNTLYYLRAYATNNAGTGYSNQVSFTTPEFHIGINYGGGMILYVDGTGQHGLIYSGTIGGPFSQPAAINYCNNLVYNGYDDWFAPIDIFNDLLFYSYSNYIPPGLYWDLDGESAIDFGWGGQHVYQYYEYPNYILPIRSF